MDDPLGAFVRHVDLRIEGRAGGPLSGLAFAAKDLFDVAGYRTGAGNPDWLRTHPPAQRTAPAVQAMVDAGATLVGKTQTDELAFSLNGENHHYGTPVNPAAPDRIPGGSSSGSASAVAGRLVDFALGTDTGGSVRAPASYCGIWGIRPSHGAVSLDGVVPLAPGFDTVGWFARDAGLLQRVGEVLLPADRQPPAEPRLLLIEDVFDLALPAARPALEAAAEQVVAHLGGARRVRLAEDGLAAWLPCFQALQWREIWETHRAWITSAKPGFGPLIADRFAAASRVADDAVRAAAEFRTRVVARLEEVTDGAVLVMPTVPDIAPLKGLPADQVVEFRNRALTGLCVAGLAGLPQISMPLAAVAGCPLGLSVVGARGTDRALLSLAAGLSGSLATFGPAP